MNFQDFEPVQLPWERRPARYFPPGRQLWVDIPFFEGPFGEPVPGGPISFDVQPGWWQGGRRLSKVKPHYAFVWPKDGKRGTTKGRWKDILQNKGPDIHVTISADKGDHLYNRQRKPRWSRWNHIDQWGPDDSLKGAPWTRKHRRPGVSYDFRARKYGRPKENTWTDARWPMEPNEGMGPTAFRDIQAQWWQYQPDEDDIDEDDFLDFP